MSKAVKQQAMDYLQKAYSLQMEGHLDEAISFYQKSIDLFPTAEAYTFMGWTYSFRKNFDEAIALCKKAIEVDPSFGNPYNDIGVYLIELGHPDEAITWFEKALKAPRYNNYFFAHYNLGRIWESKWEWEKAKECYKRALEINPEYALAEKALRFLEAIRN